MEDKPQETEAKPTEVLATLNDKDRQRWKQLCAECDQAELTAYRTRQRVQEQINQLQRQASLADQRWQAKQLELRELGHVFRGKYRVSEKAVIDIDPESGVIRDLNHKPIAKTEPETV